MTQQTPFHSGELQVQERLGVRERIGSWARKVVRSYLPDEHRAFYEGLPFIVAAAKDGAGDSWVTLLSGMPGFISAPGERHLRIDAKPPAGDPLEHSFVAGADVGLLGLEFASRRRNRVNGRLGADTTALVLDVEQSFGNCPQYIHPRDWEVVADSARTAPVTIRSDHLTAEQIDWIATADTFFVASGHRGDGEAEYFGMDASHRGGEPGFVTVTNGATLSWPDYAGNNHYNTIGNLVVNPSAGLLFVDFESGHTLQLTGRARIDWDGPAVASVPGAQRLMHVDVEAVVECRNALPVRWAANDHTALSLRVTERRVESSDTASFFLKAANGEPLPGFAAGQHLPIVLRHPTTNAPLARTYSLSASPDDDYYRLTVKRHERGAGSQLLHDFLPVGALLQASPPAGQFVLQAGSRPVVFLSSGVGVTPMLSMLGALESDRSLRSAQFIHVARNSRLHVLAQEVRGRLERNPRLSSQVFYSQPLGSDVQGTGQDADYSHVGRIDRAALERVVNDWSADFYLCGPPEFMVSIQDALALRGVPAERVFSESFGG